MPLEHVTLLCFFASYLLALVLELTQFVRASQLTRWGAIIATAAGLVAHTAYLLVRSRDSQLPPLLSSAHDWLLVLSWLTVVMLLTILLWNRHSAVALFGLPPVVVMVGAARFVSQTTDQILVDLYGWKMLHASLWVLGIAGCCAAFVISLMYLVQHRRLKRKLAEPSELHLFSLERLSRWNWWAVIVSVPLITLALMTGVFLALWSRGSDQPVRLVQTGFVLTAALWLTMAVLFGWLVTARHPGGRIVAWRTMWACGLLLLMLLLQQLFIEGGIHGNMLGGDAPERQGRLTRRPPAALLAVERPLLSSGRSAGALRAGLVRPPLDSKPRLFDPEGIRP
jgi:ABC-type uncharacterized transport system permease subunit